ncbi:hypothetical protein [Leucobacter sp. NPDC077196]|uniref:hypothetical protein n=1 Tax=Leucobacter sp. NPDC077196 TaxID=3154959 RepID=UPI003412B288
MDEKTLWVELLGVTMAGAGEPDQGLIWTDLEGWWGIPDARGESVSIPGGHGRFRRSHMLREARVITLTGHIYAANNRELHEIRDRLEEALAEGSGRMLVATDSGAVWERWVEIDTLAIAPDRGRRWTKFTVDMLAPDPCRYGPVQTVGPVTLPTSTGGVKLPQAMPWNFGRTSGGARLVLPNAGTIPIYPRIIVSGGGHLVTVRDITANRTLRLDWTVPEGSELAFDCERRRVELEGQDVTRWLVIRQWFEVPKRATHEFRFEVEDRIGDPLMTAEYRNGAW